MASPIAPIRPPLPVISEITAPGTSGAGFGAVFREAVGTVESLNANAAKPPWEQEKV